MFCFCWSAHGTVQEPLKKPKPVRFERSGSVRAPRGKKCIRWLVKKNLPPKHSHFLNEQRGKGMKINGIISTLATKGNEKEIRRKLEPEDRSTGEYFHIKKHCFQKNDTNMMGIGAQNSYQWLWLHMHSEMEDSPCWLPDNAVA